MNMAHRRKGKFKIVNSMLIVFFYCFIEGVKAAVE